MDAKSRTFKVQPKANIRTQQNQQREFSVMDKSCPESVLFSFSLSKSIIVFLLSIVFINAQQHNLLDQQTERRLAYFTTQTNYTLTGSAQSITVPPGAITMYIDMSGARGGCISASNYGKGGRVQATLQVTPGTIYNIYVGGRGADFDGAVKSGGYNGGGASGSGDGASGGGATDLRSSPFTLSNRIVVAGGGGGCDTSNSCSSSGGGGGYPTGFQGSNSRSGYGGSATACGDYECGTLGGCGSSGSQGMGGAGYSGGGGGGGGGYFGGGGGACAGGGGSSYVGGSAILTSHTSSYNSGDGFTMITFVFPSPTSQPTTQPSGQPMRKPSSQPSLQPTSQPSGQPSRQPSTQPSAQPSKQPFSQPSRQPTARPAIPTAKPSGQPSSHPTGTPCLQPSGQPSGLPTRQPSSRPSTHPSRFPSGQPTTSPSAHPVCHPTSQPSLQPLSRPTSKPTTQPSSQPSSLPTAQPSGKPSRQPTGQPSRQPTVQPTRQPSGQPSRQPSRQPSAQPSQRPSMPTSQPSRQPTGQPFSRPTSRPTTSRPTSRPTARPTSIPSPSPTSYPTTSDPSKSPTPIPFIAPPLYPTGQPSATPSKVRSPHYPSSQPTRQPSRHPSNQPTGQPSRQPTGQPSRQPSRQPTGQPSRRPSVQPFSRPSSQPSAEPTRHPSNQPSSRPTLQPLGHPSRQPSAKPSSLPTSQPSSHPARQSTGQPSLQPSSHPSSQPLAQPSRQPTSMPSRQPSGHPSRQPSSKPTALPCGGHVVAVWYPTSRPSVQPTSQPSCVPSSQPTDFPSLQPTLQPTGLPSSQPSEQPSTHPTSVPSTSTPSVQPSSQPTGEPSSQPSGRPTSVPSHRSSAQPSTQPSSRPSYCTLCKNITVTSLIPNGMVLQGQSLINVVVVTLSSAPSSTLTITLSVVSIDSTFYYEGLVGGVFLPAEIAVNSSENIINLSHLFSFTARDSGFYQITAALSGGSVMGEFNVIYINDHITVVDGYPTSQPSSSPSTLPSGEPSHAPSAQPSSIPSSRPSTPSSQPTSAPSSQPTLLITALPSSQPTRRPTAPTRVPTQVPTHPTHSPNPADYTNILGTTTTYSYNQGTVDMTSSIVVNVRLDSTQAEGLVYCGVFATTDVSITTPPVAFSSDYDIIKQGFWAYSTAHLANVLIVNMTASSKYFAYCLTVSVQDNSVIMPYSVASNYRMRSLIATLCCKLATLHRSVASVYAGDQTATSAIKLSLNAAPSSDSLLTFTFLLFSVSSPNSNPSQWGTLSTTQIIISSNYTPNTVYPIIYTAGVPGTYQINTTMSGGRSADEFDIIYVGSLITVIGRPTSQPSMHPSGRPSDIPSAMPTQPTSTPSCSPSSLPSVQPSCQPTSCPSAQPTTLPSLQPVEHPSSCPSEQPTQQPSGQPSRQPTGQPSLQPSSQPSTLTRAPTMPTPVQWNDRLTALQLSLQRSITADVAHQTMYSELDVIDSTPYSLAGGCSSWTSVLSGDLEPSSYLYKASSLQMTVLDSLTDTPSIRVCQNASAVRNIVKFVGLYSNVGLSVSCDGHMWKAKYCSASIASLPSLCVDCADPCSKIAHCSVGHNSTVHSPFAISPCVSRGCNTSTEFPSSAIRILTVGFKETEAAPVFKSITTTSTKTSIAVTAGLSGKGTMYCAVDPFNSGQPVLSPVPGSQTEIVLQNHVAAISSNNVSTVTISGLSAISNYSVYCIAVSPSNAMTPLSTVLSSVRSVQTACCKSLEAKLTSPAVIYGSSVLNYLAFTLSAAPSSPLQVSLVVHNATSNASLPGAFTPSEFAVSTTATNFASLTLSQQQPGNYFIQVILSGASANEFEVPKTVPFAIYSLTTEPPAPQLLSAVFASDGTSVLISFDSKTNKRNTSTVFTCSQLFNFTCASQSTCRWSMDGSLVTAQVLTGDQCASPYTALSVKGNMVQAYCTDTVTKCKRWNRFTPFTSVTIEGPASAASPVISMSLPSTIGLCSPLTLDISGSSGNGGRSWSSQTIAVTSSTQNANVTSIQHFLDTKYQISPPTPIPWRMLVSGVTYTFQVSVCNFLGSCSVKFARVTVLPASLPTVLLPGASLRYTTRNAPLIIESSASVTDCILGASSAGLSYQWSVSVDNVLQTGLVSTSKDPSKLLLPAYSLTVGTLYIASLTVTIASTSKSAVASVQVLVQQGYVVSVISGGSRQTAPVNSAVTIDGSSSYDEDQSGVSGSTAGLSFAWTCSQNAPSIKQDCSGLFTASGLVSKNASTFVLHSLSSAVGATVQVSVIVTDQSGARTSTSSIQLFVVSITAPLVSVTADSASGVVNSGQVLKLFGSVTLPSDSSGTAVWSTADTSLVTLSSVALSPLQVNIPSTTSAFGVYLVIAANSLPTGSELSFVLTCIAESGSVSTSSVSVTVNTPPMPGTFAVGADGTGKYTFVASKWTDSDLPITYQFGYTSNAATQVTLIVKSQASYGSSSIPAGLASANYMVQCFTDVADSYAANTTISVQIQVAAISVTDARAQLTSLLSVVPSTVNDFKQVTAVASGLLNTVNCSAAPNCAALNRGPCAKTKNTCGSCARHFVGDVGDSSSACASIASSGSRRKLSGCSESCGLFQECMDDVCIAPLKQCPSDCSDRGNCEFVHVDSGLSVNDCRVGDTTCSAVCQCTAGYSGSSDCSLANIDLQSNQASRLQILQNLESLLDLEDPDAQSVVAWINSLSEATQSPDELSEEALSLVLSLSTTIMDYASRVGLSSDYVSLLLNSIDAATTASAKIQEQRRRLTKVSDSANHTSTLSKTQSALQKFSNLVSQNMLPGQFPVQLVYSQFRSNIQVFSGDGVASNLSVSIPLSDLEVLYGLKPSSVSFPKANTSSSAVQQVSVTSMLSSLFSAVEGSLKSNPVTIQMSAPPSCSAPPCRVDIVLQYSLPLNQSELHPNAAEIVRHSCLKNVVSSYNHTCLTGAVMQLHCNGSAHTLNTQCPFTEYSPVCNSLLGSNVTDSGCFETQRTSTNITCSCPVASEDGSRRMLLSANTSAYSVSYVGMLKAVEKSFLTTIGTADKLNDNTLKSGWKAIVTIGTFAAVILVALLSSSWADEKDEKKTKEGSMSAKQKNEASAKQALKKSIKIHSGSRKIVRSTSTLNKDLAMIENSLPNVLSSQSLQQRIITEVKHHHRWLGVVFFYSDHFPRVLRVVSLATNIIIMLFIQSITYTLTNPDDGSCEALTTRPTCIAPRSPFATGESKCSWDGSECSFIQPSGSARIILFVAIFSAIISTPIALAADWIVRYILSAKTSKRTTVSVTGVRDSIQLITGAHLDGDRHDRRSAVRSNTLSTVFIAQAELRLLSGELFKYREDLTEAQKTEFDAVWGLTAEGKFMSPQDENDIEIISNMWNRFHQLFKSNVSKQPNVKQLVLDDLTRVLDAIDAESKAMEANSLSNKEIGKKLLFLFQCDLLPGISGQILHSKGQRDSLMGKRVSLAYKIFGWTCIGLLNAGMLFYILLFALSESDQRQGAWFKSFILWLVVEILLVSTGMAIFTHVVIPLMTMKDVNKIKQRLMDSIASFHENVRKQKAAQSSDDESGNEKKDNKIKPFNAAEYLFVATRVAKKYPDLKEAQIIAQFSTPWPKQSYQHVTDITQNYSRRFTAVTRALSIIAAYMITNLLSVPPTLQDMVIHMVTTATIGYTILLHIDLFGIFPLLAFGPFIVLCLVVHFAIQSQKATAKQKLAKLFPAAPVEADVSKQIHTKQKNKNNHTSRKQSVLQGVSIAQQLGYLSHAEDRVLPLASVLESQDDELSAQEEEDIYVTKMSKLHQHLEEPSGEIEYNEDDEDQNSIALSDESEHEDFQEYNSFHSPPLSVQEGQGEQKYNEHNSLYSEQQQESEPRHHIQHPDSYNHNHNHNELNHINHKQHSQHADTQNSCHHAPSAIEESDPDFDWDEDFSISPGGSDADEEEE